MERSSILSDKYDIRNCDLCYTNRLNPSSKSLKKSGGVCTNYVFKEGETIIRHNLHSDNIIYIKKGLVKITVAGILEQEKLFRIIKENNFLGFTEVFTNVKSPYSAIALEETSACIISKDSFVKYMLSDSNFTLELIRTFTFNELDLVKRFLTQVHKQINGRVADVILDMAENIYSSNSFVLNLTRDELASLAWTTRENLIRTLTTFKNDGILTIEGRRFVINNIQHLRRISKCG